MSLKHISWANFPRYSVVFLGLALAVFTWGLQYKLSLYDPPQATSHQIPTAKLLSPAELKSSVKNPLVSSERDSARSLRALAPIALALVFMVFLISRVVDSQTCAQRAREIPQPWHLRSFSTLRPFFFRPPPVLA